MDNQEAFDTIVRGLASQGFEQSMWDAADGKCAYRSPDGKKCAVGHLIPDDMYNPYWDTDNLPVGKLPLGVLPDKVDLNFLKQMQWAHDDSGYDPHQMVRALFNVAATWELDPAVLRQVLPRTGEIQI